MGKDGLQKDIMALPYKDKLKLIQELSGSSLHDEFVEMFPGLIINPMTEFTKECADDDPLAIAKAVQQSHHFDYQDTYYAIWNVASVNPHKAGIKIETYTDKSFAVEISLQTPSLIDFIIDNYDKIPDIESDDMPIFRELMKNNTAITNIYYLVWMKGLNIWFYLSKYQFNRLKEILVSYVPYKIVTDENGVIIFDEFKGIKGERLAEVYPEFTKVDTKRVVLL